MIPGPYSPYLVKIFEMSDYIPFASTVTSYFILTHKLIFAFDGQKSLLKSCYFYAYCDETPYIRCAILLFPGIGNLVIAIYDFSQIKRIRECNDHFFMLSKIKNDFIEFKQASLSLRTNISFLLDAITVNAEVLQYFSESLLCNEYFKFNAILRNVDSIFQFEHLKAYLSNDINKIYDNFKVNFAVKYLDDVNFGKPRAEAKADYDFRVQEFINNQSRRDQVKINDNEAELQLEYKARAQDGVENANEVQRIVCSIKDIWVNEIITKISTEDLDALSRVSNDFKFYFKSHYITRFKQPLINIVSDVITQLKILIQNPKNNDKKILESIANLEVMIDSNLTKGFDKAVERFTKAVGTNFRNVTLTRIMWLMKDLVFVYDRNIYYNDSLINLLLRYSWHYNYPFDSVYTSLPEKIYDALRLKLKGKAS
jgi:hypothetical protein